MSLLTVTPLELLLLWQELTECLYDVNKYDGTVAEIYAYRLYPPKAGVTGGLEGPYIDDCKAEMYKSAGHSIVALCELFGNQNRCEVLIDDLTPSAWAEQYPMGVSHRVHVKVLAL